MKICLSVVWLKGVFHVCTSPLGTPHGLVKKYIGHVCLLFENYFLFSKTMRTKKKHVWSLLLMLVSSVLDLLFNGHLFDPMGLVEVFELS